KDQTRLPVKFECLDPLRRVKSMRVEVWAGNKGPDRPFATKQPAPHDGDGPKQLVEVTYQNGLGAGDIPWPALQPGQVCWIQPVMVNAAGVEQWFPATAHEPSPYPPLQRTAANVKLKLEAGQRTLKLKSAIRMSIYQ